MAGVIIVEEAPRFRKKLVECFKQNSWQVVGEFQDDAALVDAFDRTTDLASLVDVAALCHHSDRDASNELEAGRHLKSRSDGRIRVVVYSADQDSGLSKAVADAGLDAFIYTGAGFAELVEECNRLLVLK